jgi:hypothetical protein
VNSKGIQEGVLRNRLAFSVEIKENVKVMNLYKLYKSLITTRYRDVILLRVIGEKRLADL